MAHSIFTTAREGVMPTEQARGPWDAQALHGGAPAALMAGAVERLSPAPQLVIARMSYEFLRPVPMAALRLHARIARDGRRVQELEAELCASGRPVCRLRALRLRAADVAPSDLGAGRRDAGRMPGPEHGRPFQFALDDSSAPSFAATAMEMRWLSGDGQLGPARVWMRLRHPVLDAQPATPLMRLVAAADFGNGVSAALPWGEFLFINADLTVYVHRPPEGDWIGLDSRTHLSPGGAGVAESVLHDEHGPVGRALQALVVQRR